MTDRPAWLDDEVHVLALGFVLAARLTLLAASMAMFVLGMLLMAYSLAGGPVTGAWAMLTALTLSLAAVTLGRLEHVLVRRMVALLDGKPGAR